jgi:mannosyltransferase OCH1-like enzyme
MNHLIPKKVHVTWKSKDILDNQSPMILNGLRNIIDLNPEWTVEISNDQDVDNYIKDNVSQKDYDLIKDRLFVEKSDLWRLIKIFNEGGMYIDLDRFYNIPMSAILDPETKILLPTHGDFDFSQDLMIAMPGSIIHKRAAEFNLMYRANGQNRIYWLGPQCYMHAVTSILLDGVCVNTDPGAEAFAKIRDRIKDFPSIKTYRESQPNDTLVFRYDPGTWKQGNGKEKFEFYEEFNVKHWTK